MSTAGTAARTGPTSATRGDLSGGKRPCYEASIALNGSDTQPDTNEEITHAGDVWLGQSGGPFFAWWSDEAWLQAVAVQSW